MREAKKCVLIFRILFFFFLLFTIHSFHSPSCVIFLYFLSVLFLILFCHYAFCQHLMMSQDSFSSNVQSNNIASSQKLKNTPLREREREMDENGEIRCYNWINKGEALELRVFLSPFLISLPLFLFSYCSCCCYYC